MKTIVVSLLLVLAVTGNSLAAGATGFYSSYTCSMLINVEKTNDINGKYYMSNFIGGFMTGVNYSEGRKTENITVDGLYLWTVSYCNKNPLDSLIKALRELDFELDRRAGR